MITKVLHYIFANPLMYDVAQTLAGARHVHSHLATRLAPLASASKVLDLGGGTGLLRGFWPSCCAYVCLDIDVLKLQGFRGKYPAGIVLLSDATKVPLEDGSVDVVLCAFVTHHIPDALLTQLISESARVLKSTGKLVLVDAVWTPSRWVGRLLWRYDRGSYPRTAETLNAAISSHCAITHWERFTVRHEYVLCVATQQPQYV